MNALLTKSELGVLRQQDNDLPAAEILFLTVQASSSLLKWTNVSGKITFSITNPNALICSDSVNPIVLSLSAGAGACAAAIILDWC
jgi:hypothetical protein